MKYVSRLARSSAFVMAVGIALWSMATIAAETKMASGTGQSTLTKSTTAKSTNKISPFYHQLGGEKGIAELSNGLVTKLLKHPTENTSMSPSGTDMSAKTTGAASGASAATTQSASGTSSAASVSKAPDAGVTNASGTSSSASTAEMRNGHSAALLSAHIAARICRTAGGSCKDPSTPLSTLKGKIAAIPADWSAAMSDFRATLQARKVSGSDQDRIMNAVTAVMHDVTADAAAGK